MVTHDDAEPTLTLAEVFCEKTTEEKERNFVIFYLYINFSISKILL